MSTHQTPPAEEQAFDPGFDAELFWEKNRNTILGVAAVVVVVAVATVAYLIYDHNTQLAAEEQFAEAKDAAGWKALIQSYPHSMPAANAYLLLAQAQREGGKIDESSATYQEFLKNFAKHPLAPEASLGLAQNLSLQGKTDEALAALRELQAGNAGGFVPPFAALLEGQILAQQGKLADANRVLSTAANLFPKSPAGRAAGSQANELKSVIPLSDAKAPTAPAQAPVPAPQQ